MIDLSAVKTALYTWANTASGITVVFADQSAPRPAKPYISLKVTGLNSIGHDYEGLPDATGDASFRGNREFQVYAQTIGSNAIQYAEALHSSLEMRASRDQLATAGIVFVENLGINDITELLETEWEERAQIDFRFRIASVDTENVGLIEHVEVTQTINDVDGSTIETSTYTVN